MTFDRVGDHGIEFEFLFISIEGCSDFTLYIPDT